jgi:hypothetical protein
VQLGDAAAEIFVGENLAETKASIKPVASHAPTIRRRCT